MLLTSVDTLLYTGLIFVVGVILATCFASSIFTREGLCVQWVIGTDKHVNMIIGSVMGPCTNRPVNY